MHQSDCVYSSYLWIILNVIRQSLTKMNIDIIWISSWLFYIIANIYRASYHNLYFDLVLGYQMFTKCTHSGALIISVLVVSRLLDLMMMLSLTGGKHGTVQWHTLHTRQVVRKQETSNQYSTVTRKWGDTPASLKFS